MKQLNWIEGAKRLYLVVWGLLVVVLAVACMFVGFSADRVAALAIVIIVPAILKRCIAWVFSGLQNK